MRRLIGTALMALTLLSGSAGAAEVFVPKEISNWRLAPVFSPYGVLSYVLSSQDPVSTLEVQFWCQPSNVGSGLRIVGPLGRYWLFGSEAVFVTTAIDGGAPAQFRATMYSANEVSFAREEPGLNLVLRSLRAARQALHIDVRGVPAVISSHGFRPLEREWERLCMGPPLQRAAF
jgi:hypothetical protein